MYRFLFTEANLVEVPTTPWECASSSLYRLPHHRQS